MSWTGASFHESVEGRDVLAQSGWDADDYYANGATAFLGNSGAGSAGLLFQKVYGFVNAATYWGPAPGRFFWGEPDNGLCKTSTRSGSSSVIQRNWHGGPLSYQYYADAFAYMYADAIAKSMADLSAALAASGGALAPLRARWAKRAPTLVAQPRDLLTVNGAAKRACPAPGTAWPLPLDDALTDSIQAIMCGSRRGDNVALPAACGLALLSKGVGAKKTTPWVVPKESRIDAWLVPVTAEATPFFATPMATSGGDSIWAKGALWSQRSETSCGGAGCRPAEGWPAGEEGLGARALGARGFMTIEAGRTAEMCAHPDYALKQPAFKPSTVLATAGRWCVVIGGARARGSDALLLTPDPIFLSRFSLAIALSLSRCLLFLLQDGHPGTGECHATRARRALRQQPEGR